MERWARRGQYRWFSSKRKSSAAWLNRQRNDQFVKERDRQQYRARSAFKLEELDNKFKFLSKAQVTVDLGAAPGGWSQVALRRMRKDDARVIMSDLLAIEPLPNALFVQGDFLDDRIREGIISLAGGKVDVVLSDMAPNAIGDTQADHYLQIELAEMALETAGEILNESGCFVVKVFQGSEEASFARQMQSMFRTFNRFKPKSSRSESREVFFFARGLK